MLRPEVEKVVPVWTYVGALRYGPGLVVILSALVFSD